MKNYRVYTKFVTINDIIFPDTVTKTAIGVLILKQEPKKRKGLSKASLKHDKYNRLQKTLYIAGRTDADRAVVNLSDKDSDQMARLCSVKQTLNWLIIT
jgi:hypothetical protein